MLDVDTRTRPRRLRRDLDPEGVLPTQCRGNGATCRRSTVVGADVCWKHGGQLPVVRAAADRRIEQAAQQRELRAILDSVPLLDLDAEPVTDPAALIMRLAARSESGYVECAKRINAAIEAGVEPSEMDLNLFKFFGDLAGKLGVGMVKAQIGFAALNAGLNAQGQNVIDGEIVETPELTAGSTGPQIDHATLQEILSDAARLEIERAERVEAAKVAAGSVFDGVTVGAVGSMPPREAQDGAVRGDRAVVMDLDARAAS